MSNTFQLRLLGSQFADAGRGALRVSSPPLVLCYELVRQTAVLAGLRMEVGQTAQGLSGMSVPTLADPECSRESPHPAVHPANIYYLTAKGHGCNGNLERGGVERLL